jgi:hypothetical protein
MGAEEREEVRVRLARGSPAAGAAIRKARPGDHARVLLAAGERRAQRQAAMAASVRAPPS